MKLLPFIVMTLWTNGSADRADAGAMPDEPMVRYLGEDRQSTNGLLENKTNLNDQCRTIMMNSGLDVNNFAFAVADRVHSITLRELRFWFDSEAPEQNDIPSSTLEWSSDMVLENVIDYPSPFTSPFMIATDQLLSRAVDPYFEIPTKTQGNDLWSCAVGEPRSAPCPLPLLIYRFVHKAHMNDKWALMSTMFKDLVKNPPRDRNLCPCVKDQNNAVLDELKSITSSFYEGTDPNGKVGSGVFDPQLIQDLWTGDQLVFSNYNRKRCMDYHTGEKQKLETYAGALFIYCKLKE